MKISVITAVYNASRTIGETLHSVQAQSHRAVEHIIMDGGSTDGTLDVINARLDSRTKLVSAPDKGLYDALNKGIERASGDLVGVLHADDVYAGPDVLTTIARTMARQDADGCYGDLTYVSNRDPRRIVRRWKAGSFAPEKLSRGWMPPHPTLYLRRDVFARWGGYDTRYQIAADYEAILRWLGGAALTLTYIPEVLVRMRTGGRSNRSLGQLWRKSREDYQALRRHGIGGLGVLARKNVSKIEQFF